VLEDVSADMDRERTGQLLLLAAAGLSSLFTSALLRLVLRRGLRPLDQLSRRVAMLDAERLGGERLPLAGQPQELQPIVQSFNGLLDRLAAGRERQQAFVDGVAHELRTPITLISGYAQRLRRHSPADGAMERIATEASRMGRLVADLLDIAREEAGRLEVRHERIDFDEALLVAFERLEPLCGGRLVLHPPAEGTAPLALGDWERLQQCITNLVENALKYAPSGPVELFSSATAVEIRAHVRDHGPGVADAEKRQIFGRFVRGSAAARPTSVSSGSGIGLSVVQVVMERMGGTVEVGDTPGGGADFQLALPAAREGA
jgi:two-component system, OmpR family, sensor kinase